MPGEGWTEAASAGDLRFADEEGQAALGRNEFRRDREYGFEVFDRAQRHHGCAGGEGFGAGRQYIDASQCKRTDDFAEEGYLLVL